jgi:hypothetical protein
VPSDVGAPVMMLELSEVVVTLAAPLGDLAPAPTESESEPTPPKEEETKPPEEVAEVALPIPEPPTPRCRRWLMRRREFITLLGDAAAWPLSARAQQPGRMRRVNVLMNLAEDDPASKPRVVAFQQGLQKLGWTAGRNIHLDVRFALPENEQQVQMLAKELLALSPDVVVAPSTPLTAAFLRESRNIPIVFIGVGDPVGAGFIANLARPGSNLTGLTIYQRSVAGKWLQMVKEIDPRITRVALIIDPKTSSFALSAREAETM